MSSSSSPGSVSWIKRPVFWLSTATFLFATLAVYQYQKVDRLGRKMAEREVQLQSSSKVLDEKIRVYEDYQKNQQDNLGKLEQKLHELEEKQHQSALDMAQLNSAQNTDHVRMLQYKQAIYTAVQQLTLTQDVNQALSILQDVHDDLAQTPNKWPSLRIAIENDINDLRQQPTVDTIAIYQRIDALYQALGALPLLGDSTRLPKSEVENTDSSISNFGKMIAHELRQLLRVQNIENKTVLNGDQAWLLRQRFQLLLAHTKLALYHKNQKEFSQNVLIIRQLLQQYADPNTANYRAADTQLNQLEALKMPMGAITLKYALHALNQS